MGRSNSQKKGGAVFADPAHDWKRKRKARYQPAPGGLNLEVHGVLFAVVAVVFVVYPLMQWALGR